MNLNILRHVTRKHSEPPAPHATLKYLETLSYRQAAQQWHEKRVSFYQFKSAMAQLEDKHDLAGHFAYKAWQETGRLIAFTHMTDAEFVAWWDRKSQIVASGMYHTLTLQ
jgi:hypothetical protein